MQDVWGRGAVHTGFCGERDHLEDPILDGKILLNGSRKCVIPVVCVKLGKGM